MMKLDESLVERIRKMWGLLTVPMHASPEGLDLYRREMAQVGSAGIMVFGATPEIIDLALELNMPRIVGMDIHPETLEAMRRMGTRDWSRVELYNANWLDRRPDLREAFGGMFCDAGLLFLKYPDQWKRLFEVARQYLKPGGRLVMKAYTPPPDAPSFEEFRRSRLAEFEAQRSSLSVAEQIEQYRCVATELRAAATFDIVGVNGAFDQQVLVQRCDDMAKKLLSRYPDAAFRDITEAAFLWLARTRPGVTDVITGASADMATALLREVGFASEIVFLPDVPVPNGNYVIMATKGRRTTATK